MGISSHDGQLTQKQIEINFNSEGIGHVGYRCKGENYGH
jgi:hypothetical protein